MLNAKQLFPVFLFLGCVALAMDGCESGASPTSTPAIPQPTPSVQEEMRAFSITLTSTAFAQGESIPAKYSCDGEDISPPLGWSDPPQGTQSFVLIADDPDAPAGTWVHWVLYNLPPESRALPESLTPDAEPAAGGQHGENSWRRLGYGGPCPPGGTHRYFFKLYALDSQLDLAAGETKDQVLQAMEGHVLAQTELMGTYTRE